jgi:hypothetical protein
MSLELSVPAWELASEQTVPELLSKFSRNEPIGVLLKN